MNAQAKTYSVEFTFAELARVRGALLREAKIRGHSLEVAREYKILADRVYEVRNTYP